MKKMKRLVAILLASVLALAMLTACGEEAPQSLGQRAENLMIESFNKAYDTTYQNDADLKNKVGAMLNQIDENGEIDIASLKKSKIYGLPVRRRRSRKPSARVWGSRVGCSASSPASSASSASGFASAAK